jgi:predicted adenylyl cyclase CyaB
VIEVELKARVRDARAIEAAVASFASLSGEIDKRDAYWRAPGRRDRAERRDFRVRLEGGTSAVTFKDKRVEDGIEVNVEREFGVSDPAAFADLALRLGCERWYEKRKRGLRYEAPAACARDGKAAIEIVEIEGVGKFIEIEELIEEGPEPSATAGAVAAAKSEILGFLARAGCAEADVEPRFYSELLARAGLIGTA